MILGSGSRAVRGSSELRPITWVIGRVRGSPPARRKLRAWFGIGQTATQIPATVDINEGLDRIAAVVDASIQRLTELFILDTAHHNLCHDYILGEITVTFWRESDV